MLKQVKPKIGLLLIRVLTILAFIPYGVEIRGELTYPNHVKVVVARHH